MKRTRGAPILLAVALLAGCGLRDELAAPASLNGCSRDADCPSGACRSDGTRSLCVASKADLSDLYLELDVPMDAPIGGGDVIVGEAATFGLALQGVDLGGFVRDLDLITPEPLEVRAKLEVSPLLEGCEAIVEGGRVRANLELRPVGHPVGVSSPSYFGVHDATLGGPRVAVPPGRYDVYLKPESGPSAGCDLPPVLLKNQAIASTTDLLVTRGEPSRLVGHVDVPHTAECDADPSKCWRYELLDNQRGRVIGSVSRLAGEGPLGTERFTIRFWRGADASDLALDPVLVAHPPPSQRQAGMPDLYWKLAGIDPDGDLDVSLELAPLTAALTRFIPLEASVRTSEGEPVAANVLVLSRQLLSGKVGTNALYQAAVSTDAAGNFAVNLLPGKYDLVAIPSAASDHAITVASWTFGEEDLGKGRTLEVRTVSRLTGMARTPSDEFALGLPVRVAPSAAADVSLLEAAFSPDQAALLASLPRTAATLTDALGGFELPVDPGEIDLAIQPPSYTDLPWLVRRKVSVSSSSPQNLELGDLKLTEPVVLVGSTRGPDGAPLAGVTVRAWLGGPTTDEIERPSAVGIGEATSDEAGRYRLLLPSTLLQ